jgi:hypothetical protein
MLVYITLEWLMEVGISGKSEFYSLGIVFMLQPFDKFTNRLKLLEWPKLYKVVAAFDGTQLRK